MYFAVYKLYNNIRYYFTKLMVFVLLTRRRIPRVRDASQESPSMISITRIMPFVFMGDMSALINIETHPSPDPIFVLAHSVQYEVIIQIQKRVALLALN